MKIDYSNMPKGQNKSIFKIKYLLNYLRTWVLLNLKYPWVNYNGFVRIMRFTGFAKRKISIGHNVQFGKYCSIAADVVFGNNILVASRVAFVGKQDHLTDLPGQTIWSSPRGKDSMTIVEDDVWIGTGAIILAGIKISKGSVVAAGSLVTKDIPECEIWGGIPAKKIKDRFNSEEDKLQHLSYLSNYLNEK
ncbi:acyltransferase [Saccharicrinis sp. FJH62]|uniref:acyltransferase n=1 Tax=Saccharicrinis sp. FJH62 TaxID=3344657 RepID=UPI0035D40B1C